MDNLHEIATTADFNAELFEMLSAEEGDFLEPYTDTAQTPIPTDGIGLILTDSSHLLDVEKLLGLVQINVANLSTLPSWVLEVPGVTIAGANGTYTFDTNLIQQA